MTNITRFDPFRDVASVHDEVERMLRQAFGASGTAARGDDAAVSPAGAWGPALDVEEDQDGYTVHVELPGVSPADVEVSLEDNVLTVRGERRFYDEREAEGFRRIERHFGRFHRTVRLPDRVATDRVRASHKDGVLTVVVPKAEEAKPRRIEVTAG
jgi:HSP20 family protein